MQNSGEPELHTCNYSCACKTTKRDLIRTYRLYSTCRSVMLPAGTGTGFYQISNKGGYSELIYNNLKI